MQFKLCAFADEAATALSAQIAALCTHNISLLEIRGVDGTNISKMNTAAVRQTRDMLDAAGISVWSVGSPFGKIKLTDDFDAQLDLFQKGIEHARILGATHMRIFSFYPPKAEAADVYADAVFERLLRFCEAAKGSGIMLCHENEKGIFGDIPSRCLKIHQTFPEIRAVFDPANFVQCGVSPKEAWKVLAPFVEYLHIKDANPDGTIVPAGCGIGDIPFLLGEKKQGVLTLEPHLAVFSGLAGLEATERTKLGHAYASNAEAFAAATNALKTLIHDLGGSYGTN